MKNYDVIVIGSGISGLAAAAAAAARGRKTLLAARGAGAIAFGGGTIDLLGYLNRRRPVEAPMKALPFLDRRHPYTLLAAKTVEEGLAFFRRLCQAEGYPFVGSAGKNLWLPTVAGTLKPSCLAPKTMDPAGLMECRRVVVLGLKGVKDYYPELVIRGLRRFLNPAAEIIVETVDPHLEVGRDKNLLDVARRLDSEEGCRDFAEQLARVAPSGAHVLIPPVLGTQPDISFFETLEAALNCRITEMAAPPPGVTGNRLRLLFLRHLRRSGVDMIENITVSGARVVNGVCTSVFAGSTEKKREYCGKAFVLATGGFLGGGLIAEPARVVEPIFKLPVAGAPADDGWTESDLFNTDGQPYSRAGIRVDAGLRPIDAEGRVLLSNVYVVGSNLAGYDYSLEKSGNGVALVTGYHAGMLV